MSIYFRAVWLISVRKPVNSSSVRVRVQVVISSISRLGSAPPPEKYLAKEALRPRSAVCTAVPSSSISRALLFRL